MPKARTSVGFSVAARRYAPMPRALDHEPGAEADRQRGDDHPDAIVRQEHEAEILSAAQRIRQRIRQPGRAEIVAADAFNDEREAKGEQQTVEVIELVDPLQEETFDQHAGDADHDRRNHQGRPISEAGVIQQQERGERAQHVLGAVREVDDVEHAEDNGEPQAQQRVERAVDQPDQELAEQGARRDAEDRDHARLRSKGRADKPAPLCRISNQPLTSGQLPSLSGRNASSAGIVAFSV